MNPRPEVVAELRSLFKEGATPSRLLRHIAERHGAARGLHTLIQAYFLEAFGVPILRGLNPIDDYQHADLRYAFLNEQLVHEIVQKRNEWDDGSASWLGDLVASDDGQRARDVQEAIPELDRCWPQLTAKEQAFIHRSLASARGLSETVKILARLTEQLQQQLAEARSNGFAEQDQAAELSAR